MNLELPDDEIELPDELLQSDLSSWEELEEYLVKQLGLEKKD